MHEYSTEINHYNDRVGMAFTLVEVRVVISIIALLIAILLPALSSARESGRTVICLSNERQLMIANEMYAEDNSGRYTSNDWRGNGTIELGGISRGKYWVIDKEFLPYVGFDDTQVSNLLSGRVQYDVWGARWPDQFLCPSAPETENAFDHRLSYAFNWQVPLSEYEREKIKTPDEKYAYCDAQNWLANKAMADYADWDQYGEQWYNPANAGLKYRHSEAINIVFFDGHAETIVKNEAYKPGDNEFNDSRWFPYR